jgi:hypothetical protein
MNGRRTLIAMGLLAAVSLFLRPGPAIADKHGCTAAKLNGLYVFTASGLNLTIGQKAIIELIRFNGDGTLGVSGGAISLGGTNNPIPSGETGTYTVTDLDPPDAMCAGTIAFLPSGPNFRTFITLDGDEVFMIQSDNGNVFPGTAKKISR